MDLPRAWPVLVAFSLSLGVVPGEAAAAVGDLTQKPGPAGCVSDTGSGGLCLDGTALDGVSSVAVGPGGTHVYVTVATSDAVAVFDRAADGTLAQKPGTAGCVSETGSGGLCVDGRALDGATGMAVAPDGASVYVTSSAGDAVAVFDRAPDGTLTQKPGTAGCISETGTGGACADGRALDQPRGVTVSPDGSSVYVASDTSDAVAVLDRASDGTLTQRPGLAGCVSDSGSGGACLVGTALRGALSVEVDPGGKSVYVATNTSGAVAVFDRAADGALTQKPGTAGCISDTGTGGLCADGTALGGAYTVDLSPDGTSAYVAAQGSAAVAVLDRAADGTLTQKPGTAGCISDTGAPACVDGTSLADVSFVAVSHDGRTAYVVSEGNSSVALFDRAADGTLVQKPGLAACISDTGAPACADATALGDALSIGLSPDGTSAYVASNGSDAVAVFDREPVPPFTPPPPGATDATRPVLTALSLSPPRFRAARRGASTAARVGTTVRYRLSESATVRFRVRRALPGRRARGGRRCVKPRRSNRRARRCTRWRTLRGGFAQQGATGANSLRFRGRLRGRRLRPGRYRLVATATDPAGNRSRPKRRGFRIVRR